jgi:dTDP-4-dehydrorhamnose reductase
MTQSPDRGRWLVTGAAGLLGSNAGIFLAERAEAVGMTRKPDTPTTFRDTVDVDLRDIDAATRILRDVNPDVILHCAAVAGHETAAADPEQAQYVNVVATQRLSQTAADLGARFILISTDAVFDGERGNYRESDTTTPFSLYGETKLAGEKCVAASGASHLIVRTNFFGWTRSGDISILEFFVNALRSGVQVQGYPDFVVTSMYVQDLLEAVWKLSNTSAEGLVNVASSDAVSKYEFGRTVARTFVLDETLIQLSTAAGATGVASRVRNISLNTDLLADYLGHKPPTQAEGIQRAADEEEFIAGAYRRSRV